MGLFDKINQFTEKLGETVSNNSQNNEATKSIHDEFTQKLTVGKSFTFALNAIAIGGQSFPYKDMKEITLISMPKSLVSGFAQIHFHNGKVQTLYFDFAQQERFLKAMNFANEQIKAANGVTPEYKYLLQFACGSKLEVYEDYAQLCYIPSGMKNHISNSIRAGSVDTAMEFNEFTISLGAVNEKNQLTVAISHNGESYELAVSAENLNTAREAIDYITANRSTNTWATPASAQKIWGKYEGVAHNFTLAGHSLTVTEGMDILNTYRLRFRELAKDCTDAAREQFDKKVRNLSTYLDLFPKIYGYYLAMMCDKAMEVIVAEGLWTVTGASFLDYHYENNHLAPDDFEVTLESVRLTIEKNQNTVSNIMSYVPNLAGGGFGLKGAAKGIAAATAFNVARDSVESGLLSSVSDINQAQQNELYGRIDHDILFEHVFLDYWRVFASLIDTLNSNGAEIWTPSMEEFEQASNIFTNLSNPNFPKELLSEVFLQILEINPYDADYHKFMLAKFGENEETDAIRNYFGYTDFNDPRII